MNILVASVFLKLQSSMGLKKKPHLLIRIGPRRLEKIYRELHVTRCLHIFRRLTSENNWPCIPLPLTSFSALNKNKLRNSSGSWLPPSQLRPPNPHFFFYLYVCVCLFLCLFSNPWLSSIPEQVFF